MGAREEPRWWSARAVRSLEPATYTCPLCGRLLHAMSDHVLLAPEGDTRRRRHAHAACVERARAAGRLPTRDEWRSAEPWQASAWRRLLGLATRRHGAGAGP